MKYLNFICYSLLLMLLFNTSSLYAAPPLTDHTTHTPLSLMPEPLSGSRDTFSLAATWWLPDWQGGQGTRGSDDDGGGDVEGECETYGFVTECPPPKTSGGLTYPLSGLTCHKSCSCSEDFKYNSSNCSGNYKLSGSSCDGKYNACVCKDEFRYDSSNCNGENKLGGEICNGKYNSCTLRPECTVSSKDCTYGCAEYNSCDRCISCNGNPDCDVSDKSCTYGCASYNSCSKCTSCKDNPDCSATAVSCDYGCASTNSCGICTSCSGNPDCDVADKSCDYGCASTNSCGKCTECKSCTPYSDETGCTDGTESCSDGCGGTRLCCKDHTHSYSCPSGYSTSNAGMISPITADKVCSCGATSGTCYKEGYSHSYSCPSGYSSSNSWGSSAQTASKTCSCGAASGTCYKCREAIAGDILYSDGTISDSVIADKTPVGIVAYVNDSTGFAVALTESNQTWGGYGHNVSCIGDMDSDAASADMDGHANTQCWVSDSQTHPAANYCNTFSAVSSGKGSSGWYVPAAGELKAMSYNYNAINLGLQKLSKAQISSNYYWSSSEYNYHYVWFVKLSDDRMGGGDKNGRLPVRCILTF